MTDGPAAGSRVRTVFLGSGGFAVPTFRVLLADPGLDLVGVVSAPPRPAGRRQIDAPTPIETVARDAGIDTILTPARLRAPEAIAEILDLRPDLAVLVDYGQIVPAPILRLRHGALNLHPSLLPRFRGATPIPAAILAGDAETGVTLMQMDDGLDTGPIVAQVRAPLDGTEAAPALETRLAELAGMVLRGHLWSWLRGELAAWPQPGDGATLTRPLRREDARLDPGLPAVALERQVRAYRPWPGTFIETADGRLSILAAEVGPGDGTAAGTITREGLATADGVLRPHEVQPAGGRPMPWAAYLRGHPAVVGTSVVPAP